MRTCSVSAPAGWSMVQLLSFQLKGRNERLQPSYCGWETSEQLVQLQTLWGFIIQWLLQSVSLKDKDSNQLSFLAGPNSPGRHETLNHKNPNHWRNLTGSDSDSCFSFTLKPSFLWTLKQLHTVVCGPMWRVVTLVTRVSGYWSPLEEWLYPLEFGPAGC